MKRIRRPLSPIIATVSFICLVFAVAAPFADTTPEKKHKSTSAGFFTEKEKAFLDVHPVITLSLDATNPPMNYLDRQGKLIGISIDYLKLIEEKLGIRIRIEASTWDEALKKGLNHQVDGIVNASALESRKPFLNFSTSYFTTALAVITRKNITPPTNLSQLSGKKTVIVKGTVRNEIIRAHAPDCEILGVSDPLEGLKLVSEGKADAFFEDLPVAQHMIDSYFFTNLQVALLYYHRVAGESKIGLRNDDPELLSVFNRAIAAITFEEHRKIKLKWLRLSKNIHVQRDSALTDAEKRWLAEHPVIRVASDPTWAPIEYADSEGQFHGLSIGYLNYLEKKLGIHFEISRNLNWPELVEKVKARELDMFSAVSRTAERSKYMEFTDPYLSTPIVIFTRQEIAYIKDLKELSGKKVGVVKGFAIQEWLSTDHPSIQLVSVPNGQEGMIRLQKGKIDVFVGDLVTGSYLITKLGFTNVKVAGETPYSNDISLSVRKDWSVFARILQKTLEDMTEKDRNDIYKRWISIKYEHAFNYRLLFKFLAGFLLIVLIFIYWNRRLSYEIKERMQVEKSLIQEKSKLQEALHEVKVLSGMLPICASCKKVRDDKGYWNQIETYIERHTEALFSHGLCPGCEEKLYGDQEWYKKMRKKQTGCE